MIALRIAAASAEVDIRALDGVLGEIRSSLGSLDRFKRDLEQVGEHLEKELFGVASRLTKLRDRVDRAVVEPVKGIEIALEFVSKRNTALITVNYRFDQVRKSSSCPKLSPNHRNN